MGPTGLRLFDEMNVVLEMVVSADTGNITRQDLVNTSIARLYQVLYTCVKPHGRPGNGSMGQPWVLML